MKRIKSVFSAILSVAVLLGCLGITSVTASAESIDTKLYLTADYRESAEGVAKDSWNNGLNVPQIVITAGTAAKVVVEAENLSEARQAALSFAQSLGSLSLKLTALETADATSGTELVNTTFTSLFNTYDTRAKIVQFDKYAKENEKYLAIELSCTESKDGSSYINYVELMNKTIVSFSSLSDSTKLLSVKDSGIWNVNAITASSSYTASTSWALSETDTDGYYKILNNNSGRGIGVYQGSTTTGSGVVQWDSNDSADQQWRFVKVVKDGTECYKILNKNSGLVMTYNGDGEFITQEEYTGEANQLWSATVLFGTDDFVREYDEDYIIGTLDGAKWAADETSGYTVNENEITDSNGNSVYGYKSTVTGKEGSTFTDISATVKKLGGTDEDVQTKAYSGTVSGASEFVFYILSTAELDTEVSKVIVK